MALLVTLVVLFAGAGNALADTPPTVTLFDTSNGTDGTAATLYSAGHAWGAPCDPNGTFPNIQSLSFVVAKTAGNATLSGNVTLRFYAYTPGFGGGPPAALSTIIGTTTHSITVSPGAVVTLSGFNYPIRGFFYIAYTITNDSGSQLSSAPATTASTPTVWRSGLAYIWSYQGLSGEQPLASFISQPNRTLSSTYSRWKVKVEGTDADTNYAPTDIALTNTTITEQNAPGALVGNLTATDANTSDKHTFDLVAGTGDDDNASFSITGNSLFVSVATLFSQKSSYNVRIRATDNGLGNLTYEKAFTITVKELDKLPPVMSNVPSPITIEATSQNGTVVTFPSPKAVDAVDGNRTVTCTPASGSTFPLGTTTVNCTASDTSGNTATANFTVTVQDTTAPSIQGVQNDLTVGATGLVGATVSFTNLSATDIVDGPVTIDYFPASGSIFPFGTTKVYATATDKANNSKQVSFLVTVQDNQGPVISGAPQGIYTVEATSPSGALVTFPKVTALDAVEGLRPVIILPAGGQVFPLGVTKALYFSSDSKSNLSFGMFSVKVQDTTPPTAAVYDFLMPAVLDKGKPVGDYRTAVLALDKVTLPDKIKITQTPAPGTSTDGPVHLVFSCQDEAGNVGTAEYDLPYSGPPQTKTLLTEGDPVPASAGAPTGAKWTNFGPPSINSSGLCAVRADFVAGKVSGSGVFTFSVSDPAGTIKNIGMKGRLVPDTNGAVYGDFDDPVLADSGAWAFVARIDPNIYVPQDPTATDRKTLNVLICDPDGAGQYQPGLTAREGKDAWNMPAGTLFGKKGKTPFTALGIDSGALVFESKIQGPQVLPNAEDCVNILDLNTLSTHFPLVTGSNIGNFTVADMDVLKSPPAAGGQGHAVWSGDPAGLYSAFRVTLKNGQSAILGIPADRSYPPYFLYLPGMSASLPGNGTGTFVDFGIPSSNTSNGEIAFRATLKTTAKTPLSAIITESNSGNDYTITAIQGGKAPDTGSSGVVFADFLDPLKGKGTAIMFQGILALNPGAGVTATNNQGLWYRADTYTDYFLIAREGSPAPGASGGVFSKFGSYALPTGKRGPIFVASLSGVKGPEANGFWVVDSFLRTHLAARTGNVIGGRTLKSFSLLGTVPGSEGQTRSFNNNGQIIWLGEFDDKKTSIMLTTVP